MSSKVEVCMGTLLKKAREELQLTQKEVANRTGISERLYQYYECGEREPRAGTAIKIAQALNSSVEALFSK